MPPNADAENSKKQFEIDTIIRLQTIEKSLFVDVTKVEFCTRKIYILDKEYSQNIFVFDINGMFLNKTFIGRGPNEIYRANAFDIDKKEIKF